MVIRHAAAALVLLAACGGRSPPPAAPAPAEPAPAPPPVVAPGPVDDSPLTEADCALLIDHVVDLGIAHQRRTKKPDEVPTDEQVAQIRTEMRTAMTPECLKLDRASFRCAMAARTDTDLAVCEQQAESRRE